MSNEATSVTCHCGVKFAPPIESHDRHAKCPSCGSVFFLTAPKQETGDDEESYTVKMPGEAAAEKKHAGVEGIPDWLEKYRASDAVKKGDRTKTLALIERLGAVNPTLDPMGATLYLACTHADAETSVASLLNVAATNHPAYSPVAKTFLEFVGPSDAACAQQVLTLLKETLDPNAEQQLVAVLRKIGPSPMAHVRSLIELLGSKHNGLYLWAVQSLKLIGPPAKRSVDALLKSLKIANTPFRLAVIDALGVIASAPDKVIPVLLQALKHENAEYRVHAAAALGQFGAAAVGVKAQLKEATTDKDEAVRQVATKSLSRISAGPKPVAAVGSASAAAPVSTPSAVDESIAVVCNCGKRLKAKPELVGKKVKCPGCGSALVVPQKAVPTPTLGNGSPAPTVVAEKECPTCQAMVAAAAILCVCCGFDFRSHH